MSSHVSARLSAEPNNPQLVVRIRDYGQGIPVEITGVGMTKRLGVGIAGMRERIRQFGGELTVTRSEPGTVVEAKIPLFG